MRGSRIAVVLVAIGVAASARAESRRAPKRDRVPPPAKLEQFCVGGVAAPCRLALDPLYAALAATEAGSAPRPVRISWVGDSVTADDLILDRVRQLLQERFGDGGPGFLYSLPPHPYCRHRVARRTKSGAWTIRTIGTAPAPDRLMGLGGSAAETQKGRVTIDAGPAPIATAELYYLAQPGGGTVALATGRGTPQPIETAAPAKQSRFATVPVESGTRAITLHADGKVRLFGVALEAPRGVVVDNLGVVSATTKSMTSNQAEHWQHQLEQRAPDLLVIMLGTNEAGWYPPRGRAMVEHEQRLTSLVATARAANPDRACLVIPPLDQLDKRVPTHPPRASVPAMAAAQRRAAARAGCAFWDTYDWMGGKGSSGTWRKTGLITGDYQHPTQRGSRYIADALAAGLLDGYAAWQERGGKRTTAAAARR